MDIKGYWKLELKLEKSLSLAILTNLWFAGPTMVKLRVMGISGTKFPN
jgi:hypothetical protein